MPGFGAQGIGITVLPWRRKEALSFGRSGVLRCIEIKVLARN